MPRWAAFLREYFGPDALIDGVRTFAAFYPASPRLTLLATGALSRPCTMALRTYFHWPW